MPPCPATPPEGLALRPQRLRAILPIPTSCPGMLVP
jgi:hypothetical protein